MQSLDWLLLFRAPYGERVLDAVLTTLELSLLSWVFALAIGVVAGLLREAPLRAARLAATAFVEIFRNVPLLVQLFLIYFVLPRVLPLPLRQFLFAFGWEFVSAVLTLSLYTGAKVAEHVRSGLNTVGVGVRQAAMSTGLTWIGTQRHVVGPLVLRTIVPGLTSEFVTVFKSSSLAMTIGVVETSYLTQQLGLQTFHWVEASTLGTLVYLVCAWSVAGFMGLVERWTYVPGLLRRGARP
ncbi:MAG: amino acid ABC transporter permease [Hyphomicrobiales bacterium]|nr:amino acid ABC transporter permease [Hyphomicrobiales bacterium]MBV8824547.1 amino acid ABC transporter permease [Hyphomicrobiales bacterium]MBV9426869.1 amino acid ABC transporter permease [Bradyrhizobiaceae bacterium]